jgi:hypothetical protein
VGDHDEPCPGAFPNVSSNTSPGALDTAFSLTGAIRERFHIKGNQRAGDSLCDSRLERFE